MIILLPSPGHVEKKFGREGQVEVKVVRDGQVEKKFGRNGQVKEKFVRDGDLDAGDLYIGQRTGALDSLGS